MGGTGDGGNIPTSCGGSGSAISGGDGDDGDIVGLRRGDMRVLGGEGGDDMLGSSGTSGW